MSALKAFATVIREKYEQTVFSRIRAKMHCLVYLKAYEENIAFNKIENLRKKQRIGGLLLQEDIQLCFVSFKRFFPP